MPQTEIIRNFSKDLNNNTSILELRVNNHPGVMSHICGLFSRRAYNVEKILCLPVGNCKESKIYLMVRADRSLEQITKQLQKLEDVFEVLIKHSNNAIFERIEALLPKNISS